MSSLFNDSDDDISLRTRRVAAPEYASERSVADMHDSSHDREVTLNTGTVLALFFALALICAVFFGFGYSIGRKSALPAAAQADATSPNTASDAANTTSSYKPAPGSPAIQPIPGYLSQNEANEANEKAGAQSAAAAARAANKAASEPVPVAETPATKPAPIVRTPPPATPAPSEPAAYPATDTGGGTYVQIAAVSHQEDADVLLSALRRRGYKVIQRSEAADRLIHVQIGPFINRKDAEATRQKLLSDGYNAFLK